MHWVEERSKLVINSGDPGAEKQLIMSFPPKKVEHLERICIPETVMMGQQPEHILQISYRFISVAAQFFNKVGSQFGNLIYLI